MRLLNTTTLALVDIAPNKIPPYAILSHTWGEGEVVFEDFRYLKGESKPAWTKKIKKCCVQALKEGLEYVWIDTCCIDKSSSAELSETINSMYSWYEKAQVCYAYLEDVAMDVDISQPGSAFERSRWFTRGFTLQELIAPHDVVFFSNDWFEVGRKSTLYKTICRITQIDEEILLHKKPVGAASIARRMAWAAHRETSRPEDIAYCLMGLFSVNMPMLYGEGEKAFLRLQEEIMKQSDDQSIFAWVNPGSSPDSLNGLLAPSPSVFAGCANILPYQDWEPRQPYTMTNRGLQIELPLTRIEDNMYVAALDCPSPPNYENFSFLAIFLRRLSDVDAQYARVKVGTLAKVHERSKPQTIYVRQVHFSPEIYGVFPRHFMQIRSVPEQSVYQVWSVMDANAKEGSIPPSVSTSRGSEATRMPSRFRKTFLLQKGGISLAALVVLARCEDDEAVVIALGSGAAFDVCFNAFDGDRRSELFAAGLQESFRASKPKQPGAWIKLREHWVCVKVEAQVHNGAKYYLVDIQVNPIPKPRIEAMASSLQKKLLPATPHAAPRLEKKGRSIF
ncbi:heterokaryon incompatibility protein-domain-containing protein [Aspergillus ambiguus]|uniref:heterokaryon incompatibility protein-domain-containing protein n=1 Tax=Aspergillus ambiguus TaxID=176160 RepID=UPI003CCDAEBB